MLRINLLPDEARRGLSAVEQFHRAPITLLVIGILAAIALAMLLPIPLRQRKLTQLASKIEALEAKKLQVEELERRVQQLRVEETILRSLKERRALVARWLNTLSDATPEGVWFTELTFDLDKGLIVQGSAVGQGDPGMANVTRFVQDLKADPEFAAAAKSVQIESIKRTMENDIEIVQFTIACTFGDAQKKTP